MTTIERREPTTPNDGSGRLGRRFLTVWFGQTVSTVGTFVSGIGAAIHVFTTTGSVIWLGVLSATSGLAAILAAPFLGLIDRFDRKTVMIRADLLAAAAAAVALVLAATGRLEVWHLVVIAVVAGLGNAFQVPASMAALPSLARGAVDRANGLIQLGPAIAIVLGPAIGAALVARYGIAAVYWFDAATFAVAVVATSLTPFGRAVDHAGDHRPRPAGWAPAVDWLRTEGRGFAILIALMAVVNLLLGYFNVAILALATEVGGPAGAGVVIAVGGIGMVAASLVVGARGLPGSRTGVVAGGLAVFGGGLGLAAVRPSLALLIGGVAIALSVVPVLNAAVGTAFNERVPADLQGRVFGLRTSLSRVLDPVGSLTAGLVIAFVAAPAIRDGGPLAPSVGAVIGTGSERAPALLLLAVAAGLVALAAFVRRNPTLATIDAPRAEPSI